MKIQLVVVVAALSMVLAACHAIAAENEKATEINAMAKVTGPDDFLKKVTDAGGRADFIFGDDRPFSACHASTVVETGNGELLAAWFGGKEEKAPDVAIWMSRFADDKWAPCFRAAKVNETAHWNPVLFRDPKFGIFLFFKAGPDTDYWQTFYTRSQDEGHTWSAPPLELVKGDKGGRGPVKNKPILLADGAWLAPASTELRKWTAFADRSEDGGYTWTRSADFENKDKVITGDGVIQPTFWESPPGNVHALIRTSSGRIARTNSTDGGRTWTPLVKTSLPNNNSGIDAVRLDDGRLLLVYNPVGRNWGPRTPLTLACSRDDGATWANVAHLESEPGEYSYPAIVATKKGVAVTYTWKRQRVRCWQIPLGALE